MKYLYAIVAGLVLALIFGILERESVLVEDSIRKNPPIAGLRACDLTISDGVHYKEMPSPRCYIRGPQ